ncbi:MAG: hypothetical protein JSS91_10830 [Bacteroidetes bacterium]|nr:hypothetical protein [Bacteroidota bacterium]
MVKVITAVVGTPKSLHIIQFKIRNPFEQTFWSPPTLLQLKESIFSSIHTSIKFSIQDQWQ